MSSISVSKVNTGYALSYNWSVVYEMGLKVLSILLCFIKHYHKPTVIQTVKFRYVLSGVYIYFDFTEGLSFSLVTIMSMFFWWRRNKLAFLT